MILYGSKDFFFLVVQNKMEDIAYCVLAFRWVTTWAHTIYFLTDKDPGLAEYASVLSNAALSHDKDGILRCVRDFYVYFVGMDLKQAVLDDLPEYYGGIMPLRDLVRKMSARDQEIFRMMTGDVLVSVANDAVVSELGL